MNTSSLPPVATILVVPPNPAEPGSGWLADWYLRDFLELGAVDNSPRTARGVIRERLPRWGLGHLTEVAELVATEMITNSVRTTRKNTGDSRLSPVRIWLLGSDAGVAVLVWDGVRQSPVPRNAGPGDESGRGLSIVAALSRHWDFYFPDLPFTGKVTRAFIDQALFTENGNCHARNTLLLRFRKPPR